MKNTGYTATALIELRQYLLHPGQRDTLIDLFDREFVETQEAAGMDVLGQFRDHERPDHFVWLRGFPDLNARHESLTRFYDGPVWDEHKAAANATMIDSANAMLLRAVTPDDALPSQRRDIRDRPSAGLIIVVTEQVDRVDDDTIAAFRSDVITNLEQSNCQTLGVYATEPTPNSFTRLPVRTDRTIVWIGSHISDDASTLRQIVDTGKSSRQERRVLIPTSRSLLAGATA
jgi:hypothetical protein